MAQQIKKKFIKSDAVDGSTILLEANQTLRKKDGLGGEIDVIQDLKTYTDEKVAAIVDTAPELLNTLNELAAALGDDPNFAATVSGQIGSLDGRLDIVEPKVTTLESEMDAVQAELISLDTRLDNLEAFGYDQIVYVSKNGLDTNNGKQHKPFLTITAALNSITDALPTKRYIVKVEPGNYSETIALKANVFVVGEGSKESVRITGAISMHSSFSGSDDHRSGFSNLSLLSAADFNWQTVTSGAGKLYFNEVVFGSTLNMYGHNNAIAQAQFNDCIIFGNVTISGINVGVFTDNVCFGNITLNQHPNGGMATILTATGGYCSGTVRQTTTVNDFNRRCASFLRGFPSEILIIDGPASYADVDLTSQSKQGAQKLNGGNLVALNPIIAHDLTTQMIVPRTTNSHNMGDWGKQWTWNFGYVHASTGTDLFLISYPESYAPDSAGKSIGIYTDGAGLQNNVNGGEIVLETAQTAGTGVRGKIQLNGREIDVTSKKVTNLADGTATTDAVNKGQLDAAVLVEQLARQAADSALDVRITALEGQTDGPIFHKMKIVIDESSELSYVDLNHEVIANSLVVAVGRLMAHLDEDFTVSVVGGKTRLTWVGAFAAGGEEAIDLSDVIFVTYAVDA